MDLCSNGHDEVCFEGRKCPACIVIDEKDEEIEVLNDQITDSEIELNDNGKG